MFVVVVVGDYARVIEKVVQKSQGGMHTIYVPRFSKIIRLFSQLALDAKVMGSWRTLSGYFFGIRGYRHCSGKEFACPGLCMICSKAEFRTTFGSSVTG